MYSEDGFLETPRDAVVVFIMHGLPFIFRVSVRLFENLLHHVHRSKIIGGVSGEFDDVSIVCYDGGWFLKGRLLKGWSRLKVVGNGWFLKAGLVDSDVVDKSSATGIAFLLVEPAGEQVRS